MDDYAEESQNDSVFIYFEMILNIYREFCSGELSENQFEDECFSRMEDYYNYVVFSRKIHNNYLKTLKTLSKELWIQSLISIRYFCLRHSSMFWQRQYIIWLIITELFRSGRISI